MPSTELNRAALLVDWGGVLTTDVFASFAAFCTKQGVPADAVTDLFRGNVTARALLADLETGASTTADFEHGLAELVGLPPDGLIAGLTAEMRLESAMVEAVRTARRSGVRTGLVSNSLGPGGYPKDLLEELFDTVVISGEVGLRKPDPDIYLLAARRLGLSPEQCVFVDDLRGNLKPARELGMETVHHSGPRTTLARLSELFRIDLEGESA